MAAVTAQTSFLDDPRVAEALERARKWNEERAKGGIPKSKRRRRPAVQAEPKIEPTAPPLPPPAPRPKVNESVKTKAGRALHERIIDIAMCLEGWEYDNTTEQVTEWWAHLVDIQGRKIHITTNSCLEEKWTRWNISGSWPVNKSGRQFYPHDRVDGPSPRMGCTMKKTAATVAREMQRRFIPQYVEMWDKMDRQRANDDERHTNAEEIMSSLAEASHGTLRRPMSSGAYPTVDSPYDESHPYFGAKCTFYGMVEMKISNLTPELAEEIGALILKARENGRQKA